MKSRILAPILLVVLGGSAGSAFAGDESWQDVDLRLENALWLKNRGSAEARVQYADLVLHLGWRDGRWRKYVLGWAGPMRDRRGVLTLRERQYNQMDHEGTVKAGTDANGGLVLNVEMTINPDPWIPGGKASYTLRLQRDGNVFTGTCVGRYNGRPVDGKVTGERMGYLWPAPIEDIAPAKPNEHPRLLFRKSDLPGIRKRLQTPQGREILARLKTTLGGGEEMPSHYSRARRAYGDGNERLAVGGYTLWHGMGFGFLYQVTGEEKYARLARQCVDKALAGQRDRDPRYSWVRPGGKLRAGSSYAAIAMAYDLCYDAWDEGYRKAIARKIQDKVFLPGSANTGRKAMKEPVDVGLVLKTGGGQHSPWSNHYGAWNGGGGSAILAILGDDGTDDEVTRRCHRIFLRRAKRALRVGYGYSGWFYEGHHGGRLSSNTGLVTYLIHLRVSRGLDLVKNCPEAQWLIGKQMYEIVRQGGRLLAPEKGIYASGRFQRGGMSTGGDFARGFGILPRDQRPALQWFFNRVIEPGDRKTYDAIRYPHHAVFAALFWPIGEKEKNPAEVVGKCLRDTKAQYYVFRSGWTGTEEDVIAAIWRGGATVMGMGLKKGISTAGGFEESFRKVSPDTFVVHYGESALVADMDGPSGAPMTLVSARRLVKQQVRVKSDKELTPQQRKFIESLRKAQQQKRQARRNQPVDDPEPVKEGKAALVERKRYLGEYPVEIVTVTRGPAPAVSVEGEGEQATLQVGKLRIGIKDRKVVVLNEQKSGN
ncbi:MAG: hypothetical protein ACLFV7_06110 [Phycisphaerae bacterium]